MSMLISYIIFIFIIPVKVIVVKDFLLKFKRELLIKSKLNNTQNTYYNWLTMKN